MGLWLGNRLKLQRLELWKGGKHTVRLMSSFKKESKPVTNDWFFTWVILFAAEIWRSVVINFLAINWTSDSKGKWGERVGESWHVILYSNTEQSRLFQASSCQLYIPSSLRSLIIYGHFMVTEDSSVQLAIYSRFQEFIFNKTLKILCVYIWH